MTDLPPDGRIATHWFDVADRCRACPGEWVVVADTHASNVSNIKQGTITAFAPAGSFDAVSRKDRSTGQVNVYVRTV